MYIDLMEIMTTIGDVLSFEEADVRMILYDLNIFKLGINLNIFKSLALALSWLEAFKH